MHDLPLVPSSRLEVQQLGSPVLEIEIEFERVPPGCRARRDRLAREPAVPLPDDQISQILLFHCLRAQKSLEPGGKGLGWSRWSAVQAARTASLAPPPRTETLPFDVLMQQGRHWIDAVDYAARGRSQREGTAAAAPIPAGNHLTRTLSISEGNRAVFRRALLRCNA